MKNQSLSFSSHAKSFVLGALVTLIVSVVSPVSARYIAQTMNPMDTSSYTQMMTPEQQEAYKKFMSGSSSEQQKMTEQYSTKTYTPTTSGTSTYNNYLIQGGTSGTLQPANLPVCGVGVSGPCQFSTSTTTVTPICGPGVSYPCINSVTPLGGGTTITPTVPTSTTSSMPDYSKMTPEQMKKMYEQMLGKQGAAPTTEHGTALSGEAAKTETPKINISGEVKITQEDKEDDPTDALQKSYKEVRKKLSKKISSTKARDVALNFVETFKKSLDENFVTCDLDFETTIKRIKGKSANTKSITNELKKVYTDGLDCLAEE